MGRNEERTHLRVGANLDRIGKEVEQLRGRILNTAGDGLLAEFASAADAVRCALRIQSDAARRNARTAETMRIQYRIGINAGEVVGEGPRTGGNVVNIAARLEQIAKPGGICLAAAVYDQVRALVAADYVPRGEHYLKNIREPVNVYEVPPKLRVNTVPAEPGDRPLVDPADYRPSIAVVPFRALRRGDDDAYFAAGMVDDIIRVLGGLKHLVVVARSSTLGYRGIAQDLRRAGRELNVQYVLHGSVRRSGSEIRIAVELTETATQQTIWADRYDGNADDIFELQDSIAIRTAGSIAPHLRERELSRASLKGAATTTAYDLMLQAMDGFYQRDRLALDKAEALLQRAIRLDPNYSAPLTHLAYLHILRLAHGWARDDHAERLAALKTARQATRLDSNDALALAIEGQLTGYLEKNHEAALALLDRAVALSPSCALAWSYGSFTCGIMGDTAAALDRARKAVRLAPIGPEAGPWHEHALSQAHYLNGDYEEAVAWGRLAASHGAQASNYRCLAASLVASSRLVEARAVGRRLLAANPSFRLAVFRAYTPLKGATADLFVERLRRAGLPS